MSVTISLRTLVAFAAGLAVATIVFFAFQAVTADAVDSDEATFVPITPCRLFDTRPGATNIGPRSSPLQEDSAYIFQVTGKNGDCTIPNAATAVAINLTGVSPTTATNLRLFPANAAVPNSAALNMTTGQSPTPNKLDVKLSPSGQVAVYNRFGTIHVIGDVMGYYRHDGLADLEARIDELAAEVASLDALTVESRVDKLEDVTASMSLETVDGEPTLRFTDVNVQIVSGSGLTYGVVNGRGNLIVGYNENSGDTRTGSHNLIVGTNHSYTGNSGVVTGADNTISGDGASVFGGRLNTASNGYAVVLGGRDNTASTGESVVAGGQNNTASGGRQSVVAGGDGNTADGWWSAAFGGSSNTAEAGTTTVVGEIGKNCSAGGALC